MDERILRDARFLRRDFSTGEEGLTLAAALVFGTDETIGNILPAYRIDMLERRKNVDHWDDRLVLKTNLIDSYLSALAFVKGKWPEKFFVEDGERKDLRDLIFRELIANIIIHREYNNSLATVLIIYDDRVVATNPNRARFSGPLNPETFDAEPKNPNIRAIFNVLGWADEIGSGIKNMNRYTGVYTGGAIPQFIEGESFKSILPLLVVRVGKDYEVYLHLSRLSENQLGEGRLEILRQLPLSLTLKNIYDKDELAILLTEYWRKKSGEFHSLRFLTNRELDLASLKKAGSWPIKSGELLRKRARVILSTLLLTLEQITLVKLADGLGYNSKERYRDDYVKPLKDNGLIAHTIAERANDPNQAYIITGSGKDFLSGGSL